MYIEEPTPNNNRNYIIALIGFIAGIIVYAIVKISNQ